MDDQEMMVNGTPYGPGAWLYLKGQPVTVLGIIDGEAVWYTEGHLGEDSASWASAHLFTEEA